MRNLTFILIIIFLGLRFGYPAYQDWKLENKIREEMQSAEFPEFPNNVNGLPIKGDAEQQYPDTKITLTLTEVGRGELTTTQLINLSEQIKEIPCRNLEMFRLSPSYTKVARANVMRDDKISMTIAIRNKNNEVIDRHIQLLSECSNFDSVFTSKL